CRVKCCGFFRFTEFDDFSFASTMQVGTELAFCALALHGSHHLAVDDKGPDVCPSCLLNEFLHNNTCFQSMKSLNNRLACFFCFCQYDPQALGSLQKLDDQGCAAYMFHQLFFATFGEVRESRLRHTQPFLRQNMQASQFAPAAYNPLGFNGGKNPHQFKLPRHRGSIKSDRSPYSRYNGINIYQFLPLINN